LVWEPVQVSHPLKKERFVLIQISIPILFPMASQMDRIIRGSEQHGVRLSSWGLRKRPLSGVPFWLMVMVKQWP